MNDAVFNASHTGPGPVVAVVASGPLAEEMRWRCQVCGREMAYSQPISLQQQCLLLGAFIEGHAPCGKEVASE